MPIYQKGNCFKFVPKVNFPMDSWDTILLADYDPRLPKDLFEHLLVAGHTITTVYDTKNIYILPTLKKIIRWVRRIEGVKGNNLTFEEATIKVMIRAMNHEYMHKSLYETEGLEAAQCYDLLVGGFRNNYISGACSLLKEEILQ